MRHHGNDCHDDADDDADDDDDADNDDDDEEDDDADDYDDEEEEEEEDHILCKSYDMGSPVMLSIKSYNTSYLDPGNRK